MVTLLVFIYLAAGYWATGKTIYANKIIIYSSSTSLFIQRVVYGGLLGWALIPWALIKMWLYK